MSKIKLEVGMRMKCAMHGEGDISAVANKKEFYPIMIFFEGEKEHRVYTEDGRFDFHCNSTIKLLNIPFTEDMEVECDIYGSGVVTKIHENIMYQKVQVSFSGKLDQYYTEDGRINTSANQTLFPKFTI